VRVFGIDPGSERTGYGCVETDGRRHRLVTCGTISAIREDTFPQRLARIHRELSRLLAACRPDCVAVENLFHATNVRSALKLGHARGVAMLAAVEAGCTLAEYTPAEVKRAVVGYGRAEKRQVQHMIKLLLGLPQAPSPHDAADALAVAICHSHTATVRGEGRVRSAGCGRAGCNGQCAKCAYVRSQRRAPDRGTVPRAAASGTDPAPRTAAPRTGSLRSWRQYRPPAGG
jgi:crossover junction endodeoxyribonuclease RuvC